MRILLRGPGEEEPGERQSAMPRLPPRPSIDFAPVDTRRGWRRGQTLNFTATLHSAVEIPTWPNLQHPPS